MWFSPSFYTNHFGSATTRYKIEEFIIKFLFPTAGQAPLAGRCIWNCGWKHTRNFWSGEHEEGSLDCYKVGGKGCFTEATYCRGISKAKGSLYYSAQIPWILSKWELIYSYTDKLLLCAKQVGFSQQTKKGKDLINFQMEI